MKKVVIATKNRHKFGEIRQIIQPESLGIELVMGGEITDAPAETGKSFFENALIKAKHYSEASGLPAIADDSGLIVNFLGQEPGLYSARYAGENATYEDNNRKLLSRLEGFPPERRIAYFICVAVLYLPDGRYFVTSGLVNGKIAAQPRGEGGFGYDPIFELPDGRTMAQLSPEEKNRISHRGRAFRRIALFLKSAIREGWI
ncbi:RdgB/HAM1 family non-canonical purine NTP pyrophosphatase [bacterium]|nr:RdgB/HAM1 family non-canonical purine NTP pyrophosphatase [bacterium]